MKSLHGKKPRECFTGLMTDEEWNRIFSKPDKDKIKPEQSKIGGTIVTSFGFEVNIR